MAFVSVTRLRIRRWRFLPAFLRYATRTRRQVAQAAGFRGGSLLADRRWTFWTLTAWNDQASMQAYVTTGDHRTAMPHLLDWCDEASVVHWNQDEDALPSWPEVDRRMRGEGRPSKVRHPSPAHAALAYDKPRTTAAGPIRPAA